MAGNIKGITIEIGGDTTKLDKALKGVNSTAKDLDQELKAINKSLKFNPGNSDLVEQKQRVLAESVANTTKKLDQLKDAAKQAEKQLSSGKMGKSEFDALTREILKTENQLKSFENQLKSVDEGSVKVGDSLKSAGNSVKSFGEDFKMAGAAAAAAIGGLVAGTEDMRKQMAILETNATQAGLSFETMQEGLVSLAAVSDDTEANVEALSNMIATGFSEKGMLEALEALNGAAIKFSETLQIEGLADGLQETLATGQAIGPFAELLERSGVALDVFNAGLEEAIKNGTEEQYVLDQLNKMGLAEFFRAFEEGNPELVAYNEAMAEMKMALSELSLLFLPIITAVTEFGTKLIEAFLSLPEPMQKFLATMGAIAAVFVALGPVVSLFVKVFGGFIGAFGEFVPLLATGAKGLTVFSAASSALALLLSPQGLLLLGLAALVAIFVKWPDISEKAGEAMTALREKFGPETEKITEHIDNLNKGAADRFKEIQDHIAKLNKESGEEFSSFRQKIKELNEGAGREFDSFGEKVNALKQSLEDKFENIKQIMSDKIKSAVDAVKEQADKLKKIFDFEWKLPELKLPKFQVKGQFGVNPPSVPEFQISWHKEGGIFTKPTLLGNHGVGEAGAEAVLPIEKLSGILADTLDAMGVGGDTIIMQVNLDEVSEVYELVKMAKREKQARRQGVVNYA